MSETCSLCGTPIRTVEMGDEALVYEWFRYYDSGHRRTTGPFAVLHTASRCALIQSSTFRPAFPPLEE